MKIFSMNNDSIKEQIIKMNKTTYGKIVFLLAYSIPIFLILLLIPFTKGMMCFCYYGDLLLVSCVSILFPLYIFLILLFFIRGSKYYYNELNKFIESKNNNKK